MTPKLSLANLRVLVVDDNATNRSVLAGQLKCWDAKPELAESGLSALACIKKAQSAAIPYDLVLTDAHMPEMDGFSLVEHIRADPNIGQSLVIMMLTSGGHPKDAARCRELGLSAYLTKPLRRSELRQAILNAVASAKGLPAHSPGESRHAFRERRRISASLNILLAEDNLVNQHLTRLLLEKRSHNVAVVCNGREALQALDQQVYDLLLMDIQMPEMDGFDATALIRKNEEVTGDHLPIIAMTAHAMKEDRERCLAAGMDGYISKPISRNELFEVIESVLSQSDAQWSEDDSAGRWVRSSGEPA